MRANDLFLLNQHRLRTVSGTYASAPPPSGGWRLDLRVDIDGRRRQNVISGDFFACGTLCGTRVEVYHSSFVVETITADWSRRRVTLSGGIRYYNDPATLNHALRVVIPRASRARSAPEAIVEIYVGTTRGAVYACPKTSEYFRTVQLEIDSLAGTGFPPAASTATDPHPTDLQAELITCAECFLRAGIDMAVTNDETLTVADSADAGSTWNYGELHDLMENHFGDFANTYQWKVYGIIVDRMSGDVSGTGYDAGLYGVLFDFGSWQAGDSYLRQGVAIAFNALTGRVSGNLYNTAAKQDRFFLETFAHEIGHAFNLPHSWQRSTNPDSASNSFMNYPWGYTGGGGTEAAFWSDFCWEFDDVELAWMRHGNLPDVIFGGNNWISNNLTTPRGLDPIQGVDLRACLELRSPALFELAEPVHVELRLRNPAGHSVAVPTALRPEDGLMTILIRRPDGSVARFVPPMRCERAFGARTTLAPHEALYQDIDLAVGAGGWQFAEPGEYVVKAYGALPGGGIMLSRSHRFRVAAPMSREAEELAYLMFGYEASMVLYYAGSRRHARAMSELTEATEKHAKSSPRAVRRLHAALGPFYARKFKYLTRRNGQTVVASQKADLEQAVFHLSAARELDAPGEASPLGHLEYNRTSKELVDVHISRGDRAAAIKVLEESVEYFERHKVTKRVIDEYRARLADERAASS